MLAKTKFTIPHSLIAQVAKTDLAPNACNKIMAIVDQMEPQDDLEAMLIAQMVACHNVAMRFAEKATHTTNNVTFMEKYGSIVSKMMRTFALQVEALSRYREGWGKRTMIVKHLHVNGGAQAVIGNVSVKDRHGA